MKRYVAEKQNVCEKWYVAQIVVIFLALMAMALLVGCGSGGGGGSESSESSEVVAQCDPMADPYCNPDGTWARCGDGIVNYYQVVLADGTVALHNENCDKNGKDTADCDGVDEDNPMESCTLPECGDGHYNPMFVGDNPNPEYAEKGLPVGCDDGNGDEYDGCTSECAWEGCGDGKNQPYILTENGEEEECDNPGPDCNQSTCQVQYTCDRNKFSHCIVIYEDGKEPCTSGDEYWKLPRGGTILKGSEYYDFTRMIICEGDWRNEPHVLTMYGSQIVGFDPPKKRLPTTLVGEDEYYRNFVAISEEVYIPSETDTIIRPTGTMNTFYVMKGTISGSYNSPAHSWIMGLVIESTSGNCCIQTAMSPYRQKCSPCAGIREFCTSWWIFKNNVFIGRGRAIHIEDTMDWAFNSFVIGNVFMTDIYIGYGNGVRFNYNIVTGRSLVLSEGNNYIVEGNTFLNSSVKIKTYNPGTKVRNNNFLGNSYHKDTDLGQCHFENNFHQRGCNEEVCSQSSEENEWIRDYYYNLNC